LSCPSGSSIALRTMYTRHDPRYIGSVHVGESSSKAAMESCLKQPSDKMIQHTPSKTRDVAVGAVNRTNIGTDVRYDEGRLGRLLKARASRLSLNLLAVGRRREE
jgi:hypothetical protein